MKYGYQEIENGIIIKGKLYEAVNVDEPYCTKCDMPFHERCWDLCSYFDKQKSPAIFKRIVGNVLLKLQEDEEG